MKLYRLSGSTFYDHINTICQFIKPIFWLKCLFLRNIEPLKRLTLDMNVRLYLDRYSVLSMSLHTIDIVNVFRNVEMRLLER